MDEHLIGYCDSHKTIDVKDIAKSYFTEYPERLEVYRQGCFQFLPNIFKAHMNSLMSVYNQSGGTVCNML